MSIKRYRSRATPRSSSRHDQKTKTVKDIGYGKPPPAHQFKPGQSGNPLGRPKGAKNESTVVRELLHRKVEIHEGARTRTITLLEAIHLRIIEDSLKGNTKSAAFILNRYAALVSGETPQSSVTEDEEQILQAFIQKVRTS